MNLSALVENRISHGNLIFRRLASLNIEGVSKLRNKIRQEINFLEKHLKNNSVKEEHLICSNLTHLEAVTSQLLKHEEVCISIMKNKTLKNDSSSKKICIDLILHGGSVWMKVIARNKKALTLVSNGDCSFGQKSILDQAWEFIQCSKKHIYYFKPPTVIFFFANGIDDSLASDLDNIGIKVEKNSEEPEEIKTCSEILRHQEKLIGTLCPISIKDILLGHNLILIKEMKTMKLNLGVTTMIAYVSAITNGGCHHNFKSEILRKHAEWERARPVKPILDKLFEGKELYCCRTAAENFSNILNVLGGESERRRGEELLKRLKIVDDYPTSELKFGGKIKERSLAIFGTGKYLKAITVTANHAFIRSAMNRGIYFEVFLHESRALTEGKELPF